MENLFYEMDLIIEPALSKEVVDYIQHFSRTRKMVLDLDYLDKHYDPKKYGFKGSFGRKGEYFVNLGDSSLKDNCMNHPLVINVNNDPEIHPNVWCDFFVSSDGSRLKWREIESTDHCEEWMNYLINHFIAPSGSFVNGKICVQGEFASDYYEIHIENNIVTREDVEIPSFTEIMKIEDCDYEYLEPYNKEDQYVAVVRSELISDNQHNVLNTYTAKTKELVEKLVNEEIFYHTIAIRLKSDIKICKKSVIDLGEFITLHYDNKPSVSTEILTIESGVIPNIILVSFYIDAATLEGIETSDLSMAFCKVDFKHFLIDGTICNNWVWSNH